MALHRLRDADRSYGWHGAARYLSDDSSRGGAHGTHRGSDLCAPHRARHARLCDVPPCDQRPQEPANRRALLIWLGARLPHLPLRRGRVLPERPLRRRPRRTNRLHRRRSRLRHCQHVALGLRGRARPNDQGTLAGTRRARRRNPCGGLLPHLRRHGACLEREPPHHRLGRRSACAGRNRPRRARALFRGPAPRRTRSGGISCADARGRGPVLRPQVQGHAHHPG